MGKATGSREPGRSENGFDVQVAWILGSQFVRDVIIGDDDDDDDW